MADWKLSAAGSRQEIETALDRASELDGPSVTGFEIAPDRPDEWQLDAYFDHRPTKAETAAVAALFDDPAPALTAEKLPDTDWLTESQKGTPPIRAGRFHIHTPDHPPMNADGVTDFVIPASQAFGTGQHETTAGCLAMLDAMRRGGVVARNAIDVGTGTGLLAFAALDLWPRARATASDIDPVCEDVIAFNMGQNGIAAGSGPGRLTVRIAPGLHDRTLIARAPYDLIIANILAAPLIELAPDFALAAAPRANIVLAGLLETQEEAVRRAYARQGFRLAHRLVNGDWSILWLRGPA